MANNETAPEVKTFESKFNAGIELFRANKFQEAASSFEEASQLKTGNTASLTNEALSLYKAGQQFQAIALLRRAQKISPLYPPAEAALKFATSQLAVKEIPHEIQLQESLRQNVLSRFPASLALVLALSCLAISGWKLIGYFGEKRRAFLSQLPFPRFPTLGLIAGLICITSSLLFFAKFVDDRTLRGTIVLEKVSVMSAPDEKSVSVLDLYGGFEVNIESIRDSWVQVTYPGTSTGWIPKNTVILNSTEEI